MKHIWTVFCRDVLEEKSTDVPSLINVTERIGFRGDLPDERPCTLPFPFPVHIVSNWWREESDVSNDFVVRVRFLAPDRTELRSLPYDIEFGPGTKFRSIGRIVDLPFTENGVYEFEISYQDGGEWIQVAGIPLEIVHEQSDLDKDQQDELAE